MSLGAPHHDPSQRWVSDPTPGPGETVAVTVDVPAGSGVDRVVLRVVRDGEPRWVDGRPAPTRTGHEWRFELECHNPVVTYRFWCDGPGGSRWLTGLGAVAHDPLDHHDFRLLTTGGAPAWVPETVWYQIFPDRFATSGRHLGMVPDWAIRSGWSEPVRTGRDERGRQMFGGDLDGVVDHLDHLVDLGVGGIYLTPVFPARSNHRYDASSFDRVDPVLGGDDALARLRAACTRAGLRLMTDITLNHTGVEHEWFRAARADAGSDEAGYYYFSDHPDAYETWLGVRSLPKLNHASEPMRRRLYDGPDSVLGRFLRPPLSMDGWRVDVANMTGRLGMDDHNALVRTTARRTSDAIGRDRWLVAEHWFDASADVMGDGWHGVMNYAGVTRPIASWLGTLAGSGMPAGTATRPGRAGRDGIAVAASIDDVRAAWPWQSVLGSMSLLGSHDTARWRSVAGSDELAVVGLGLLMTLPGSPSVFYGDEVGLAEPDADLARAPMPWNSAAWDHAWLATYRRWIRLRAGSVALAHGGFRWVERSSEALAFVRETPTERVLVRAARAAAVVRVPWHLFGAVAIDRLIGDGDARGDGDELVLAADRPDVSVWQLS